MNRALAIGCAVIGAVGLSITITAACAPDPIPAVIENGGPVDPASIMEALETPCAVEDDDNCYWLAEVRGNGQGDSFLNVEGHIFPLATMLADTAISELKCGEDAMPALDYAAVADGGWGHWAYCEPALVGE